MPERTLPFRCLLLTLSSCLFLRVVEFLGLKKLTFQLWYAYNWKVLCFTNGLLWVAVACCFGLLCFPTIYKCVPQKVEVTKSAAKFLISTRLNAFEAPARSGLEGPPWAFFRTRHIRCAPQIVGIRHGNDLNIAPQRKRENPSLDMQTDVSTKISTMLARTRFHPDGPPRVSGPESLIQVAELCGDWPKLLFPKWRNSQRDLQCALEHDIRTRIILNLRKYDSCHLESSAPGGRRSCHSTARACCPESCPRLPGTAWMLAGLSKSS